MACNVWQMCKQIGIFDIYKHVNFIQLCIRITHFAMVFIREHANGYILMMITSVHPLIISNHLLLFFGLVLNLCDDEIFMIVRIDAPIQMVFTEVYLI